MRKGENKHEWWAYVQLQDARIRVTRDKAYPEQYYLWLMDTASVMEESEGVQVTGQQLRELVNAIIHIVGGGQILAAVVYDEDMEDVLDSESPGGYHD